MFRELVKQLGCLFSIAICCALISGCGSGEPHKHDSVQRSQQTFDGEYPINVVCTTGQVAELVRRVGGQHIEVTALMDHSVDPHLYKPLFDDVERLTQADIIFYNGLHLEGRLSCRATIPSVTAYVGFLRARWTNRSAMRPSR